MSKFREYMDKSGYGVRDVAVVTGESTALVSYVARDLAHFPRYEQLEDICKRMNCKPTDVYTTAELRVMYPEHAPKRRRSRDGNPRVRVSHYSTDWIKAHGYNVTDFVDGAVARKIYSILAEEGKI